MTPLEQINALLPLLDVATFNMMRLRYREHRHGAKRRGVPFLISFEEWATIWYESGRWEDRGVHRGQYVMARNGDVGAYAVGNVSIILATQNRTDSKVTDARRAQSSQPGENNPRAKLTARQVSHIRRIYKPRSKQYGSGALGRAYGVDADTILDIIHGRLWRQA